jgi:hypothetical protein
MWEQLLDQFNMFFECHVTCYFVQPTLRILGRELVYDKALGWGHSQNKGPRMRRYQVWPCILGMSPTPGLYIS